MREILKKVTEGGRKVVQSCSHAVVQSFSTEVLAVVFIEVLSFFIQATDY